MFSITHYAQNYADIIGGSLLIITIMEALAECMCKANKGNKSSSFTFRVEEI